MERQRAARRHDIVAECTAVAQLKDLRKRQRVKMVARNAASSVVGALPKERRA